MGLTQVVVTSTGTAMLIDGILVDPAGAVSGNVLSFNGTAFVASSSGSTGNYVFSANNVTLTGAATATMFTSTATGLTIGGSNLTSGFTITGAAASTITTTSGSLNVTAAGTVNVNNITGSVVLGNASNIVTLRGGSTSSFDFSAGSGVFKTTTGTHTFGSATWGVPANTVITGASSATNTTALTYTANVADGATSIAHLLNNSTALANAGAKLLSIQNAGSEKVYFDKDGTAFLTRLQFIGGGTSLILGGAINQSVGGFRADADNARDLGTSGTQWSQTFCYIYGTKSPSTLASAATITPTQTYHKVSGTTSVSTIATGSLPGGFAGMIYLTCTGVVPFATGGNILTAFTATANKTYCFVFDGTNWSVVSNG